MPQCESSQRSYSLCLFFRPPYTRIVMFSIPSVVKKLLVLLRRACACAGGYFFSIHGFKKYAVGFPLAVALYLKPCRHVTMQGGSPSGSVMVFVDFFVHGPSATRKKPPRKRTIIPLRIVCLRRIQYRPDFFVVLLAPRSVAHNGGRLAGVIAFFTLVLHVEDAGT